jgi:acyl-CoA synthetase (NDP forming)
MNCSASRSATTVRIMGPNIYGFYYTPQSLCATFCTPYDVKGRVALSSQSGGVGMSIVGFSRSTRMGVSAIVGLGNKSDLDEDDLLTYFEQDDNTSGDRHALRRFERWPVSSPKWRAGCRRKSLW